MAALTSLALVTVGPDAEELKPTAIAYNDGLVHSFDHVLPLTVDPGQFDPESSGPSDLERQILMLLGRWCFSRVADRADVIALGR
jgi:hypothetical protein